MKAHSKVIVPRGSVEAASFLFPVLLLAAAACGPGEEAQGISDAEYFGLVPGRCLGLRGGPSGIQEVTVGVEAEHVIGGLDVLEVRYRINGNIRRVEYVHAANGELRVVRREDPGTDSNDAEFDPPYLISKRPLHATVEGPRRTTTTSIPVDGSGETREWQVSVSIEAKTMTELPGFDEPVAVYRHFANLIPTEGDNRSDTYSIAPEVGFTMLNLHGDDFPQATLAKIWNSDEPCREIPAD